MTTSGLVDQTQKAQHASARQHASATAVQAAVRGSRARAQLIEELKTATASINESFHEPAGLRTPSTLSRPSSAWHAPWMGHATDPNAHLYYA